MLNQTATAKEVEQIYGYGDRHGGNNHLFSTDAVQLCNHAAETSLKSFSI